MREPIGAVIRDRRKKAKLSQKELGVRVGATKATISNIESALSVGKNQYQIIAKILYVFGIEQSEAVDFSGLKRESRDSASHYVVRLLPVLNYVQAGFPTEFFDDYESGAGMYTVAVDQEMAEALSEHAFALEIQGDSMLPTYQEGEQVIIDPSKECKPGDVVVAKFGIDQAAVLKKYRPRGYDPSGLEIIELKPENDDYPTIITTSENTATLIGPVVFHIRRPRR